MGRPLPEGRPDQRDEKSVARFFHLWELGNVWGVVANSFPGHCPQTWDSQPGCEDLVFEIREYYNIIITIITFIVVFCSILSSFYPSKHHHLHHQET